MIELQSSRGALESRRDPNSHFPALGREQDRVVLIAEAALITGLSTKTLKRMAVEGSLKLFKVSPRRVAVMMSELQRWIDERLARAAA